MPSKRNKLLKQMQDNREQSFRPRMWNNGGQPMNKVTWEEARKNADENDKNKEAGKFSLATEVVIPTEIEEIDPENLPPGAVVMTEEQEADMLDRKDVPDMADSWGP